MSDSMIHGRPKIILHAGLPKCGTSTLQSLFNVEGHYVSHALDLVWIGRQFRPWANGATVVEIMYDKEGALAMVEKLELNPTKTYFMSSEALCSNTYMLDAIARRFDISHIILTVRMPLPMVLSEYCWSGWLYRAPQQVFFSGRIENIMRTRDQLANYGPVVLCPIEPPLFATRFCKAVAGRALPDIEQIAERVGKVNVSIPPSLAAALHDELSILNIDVIPGPMRRFFVGAAMKNQGPEEFRKFLPQPFQVVFRDNDYVDEEMQKYGVLLAEGGLPYEVRREAIDRSRALIDGLARLPIIDGDIKIALRKHAALILTQVRESNPNAIPG